MEIIFIRIGLLVFYFVFALFLNKITKKNYSNKRLLINVLLGLLIFEILYSLSDG